MAHSLHLSIRALCEFLLRSGSIDSHFSGLDRAAEGARIHRRLQKQGGRGYRAEVPLYLDVEASGFLYHLSGRADGVIDTADGLMVDEIKTLTTPLESLEENQYPAHWAQGCCYAHILCQQQHLPSCQVRLTYYNTEFGDIKMFSRPYTAKELSHFVLDLLARYGRWAQLNLDWEETRNASLQALRFPFAHYRAGQRQMAIAAYNTCKEGGRLFSCAPTGIGKTASVLFPTLKALGEGHGQRIFYLTAKTITRQAAEDTLERLRSEQALALRSLTLTAKDKICFLEKRSCSPEICPYANGYYDRVNDAVYALLEEGAPFSRHDIEEAARRYRLCPYELSLDLALFCDCIICDYNYLFDPVVHLQRFFEAPGGEHLFLVDEAHNLVDRSREMYSARLQKSPFYALKKRLSKPHTTLHRALAALNKAFVSLRRQGEAANETVFRHEGLPAELETSLEKFVEAAKHFLEDHRGHALEETLLDLYFQALFYRKIAENFDENYIALIYLGGGEVTIKLFCLDPSAFLQNSLALGRAAVLFSATLLPLPYYRETLGGGETAKLQALESPFSPRQFGLFVASGISTKYNDRQTTLPAVADMLACLAKGKTGNYIAYFPSYQYMRQAADCLCQRHPGLAILMQEGGMDEEAREHFLASFRAGAGETLLGFCVLGGIFAEGIDLPGERLIGTAVVGVGLPQIGPEPDAIRQYYDEKNGFGYEYAYQFPGMNKVLQAAGRVIRTERDHGVVLLIDSRFSTRHYQTLFPLHWSHWQNVTAPNLPEKLMTFWQDRSLDTDSDKAD